jgi:beta-lactamase superfamily II metal-dependent hydrolase
LRNTLSCFSFPVSAFPFQLSHFIFPMSTPTSSDKPRRTLIIQLALVAIAIIALIWRAQPDGRLHVFFLETAGDAALIQTPKGRYVLIDGGADPAALATALGRRLPFWRRNLDVVVLTLPDRHHLPGQIAALARYRTDLALVPHLPRRNATVTEWMRLLKEHRSRVRTAYVGEQLQLDGALLRVLATGDGDDAGMLLRLDYGATSVLFAHTAAAIDAESLASSGALRPATLAVYPWQHDAHTDFVAALRPQAFVLTDGVEADRPIEQTFVERAIHGADLYHERLHGLIEWISDGRRARIVTER